MRIDESGLPVGWEAGLNVVRDAAGEIRELRRVVHHVSVRGDGIDFRIVGRAPVSQAQTLQITPDGFVYQDVFEVRYPGPDPVADLSPEGADAWLGRAVRDLIGMGQHCPELRCTVCGTSARERRVLSLGPMGRSRLFLCEQCVSEAVHALDDEQRGSGDR